jgi:hypothetical protein
VPTPVPVPVLFCYQPPAALLRTWDFAAFSAPPQQARYGRPSERGQETVVLYEDGALMLFETVDGQLLYRFQGHVASEAEFRILLRQVDWTAEGPIVP